MEHYFIPNYWECLDLNDANGEIWVDIVGYEGMYMVSNYGRVKSLKRYCKTLNGIRTVPEKIRKQQIMNKGYLTLALSKNDIDKDCLVHILVANCYGLNPKNKPTINHNDGNKKNNFFWNLEGATYKEQDSHARRTGLKKSERGDKCNNTKLKSYHIDEILKSELSAKELSTIYNVGEGTIYAIRRGYKRSSVTKLSYNKKFLTKKKVLLIFNSTMKQKDALKTFGIKKGTYHRIKAGITWPSVTGKTYKKSA
jgi:hypothetical protein